MVYAPPDVAFAARISGVPRADIVRMLRGRDQLGDAEGLGWIQLVALAASLAVSEAQKKRAKDKAKKEARRIAAEEEKAARAELAAQQAAEQQRALAMAAEQQRALAARGLAPGGALRSFSTSSTARASASPMRWALPAGIAVGAVALVLALRK